MTGHFDCGLTLCSSAVQQDTAIIKKGYKDMAASWTAGHMRDYSKNEIDIVQDRLRFFFFFFLPAMALRCTATADSNDRPASRKWYLLADICICLPPASSTPLALSGHGFSQCKQFQLFSSREMVWGKFCLFILFCLLVTSKQMRHFSMLRELQEGHSVLGLQLTCPFFFFFFFFFLSSVYT